MNRTTATTTAMITGLLLTALMLPALATPASAATATPTLRPIPSTPTSAYIYLRPTPTMWNIGTPDPAQSVNIAVDTAETADISINAYNWLNSGHLLDIASTGVLMAYVFGVLLRIADRNNNKK